MRVRVLSDISRHPAGLGLRSGPGPVGAGCLLFLLAFIPSVVAAPLDCAVMGARRWCLKDDSKPKSNIVVVESDSADPHPATVKQGHKTYDGIGQQVRSIRGDAFLPAYFVPSRAQLGISKDDKPGPVNEP